jgi:HrpA-like helicases
MYNIVPVVPAFQTNPAVLKHKATLPVTQYKNHIMQTVLKNQVLILTGDTGSGKSTQVCYPGIPGMVQGRDCKKSDIHSSRYQPKSMLLQTWKN